MQTAVSGGFGITAQPKLMQQGPCLESCLANLREGDTGLGVEVDTKLVGHLGLLGKIGPGMEPETAEVHRPKHVGQIRYHERV